jgi:HlyD family type I secretion membrane fusion protein
MTGMIPLAQTVPPRSGTDDLAREKWLAGGVAALFFVVFLGWAAMVPLDSGALASGTVTVSGSRQAVQHRDGGIVSAIHVQEGSVVRKGQVLLSISAGEIHAAERGLTAELFSLLAQRQRLLAERDGLGRMTPPAEFAGLTGPDRLLAQTAWDAQLRQFGTRNASAGAQKNVLTRKSRQTDEQIRGYRRQIQAINEQRRLLAEELKGMREIAAKGFAATNRIRALERSAAALDGEYGALTAEVARGGEAIGEVSMQSIALDRDLAEQASEQLRQVSLQLDKSRPRLAAVRAQLARAQVRAPTSGKVVGLSTFTIGGVVSPGQLLMEIVPQDRELVVSGNISPRDADDVHVGQSAQIRFTALQERNLPILNGTISRLSADSFTDERSGEQFFRAELKVPAHELARAQAIRPGRRVIQPGLPVDILIPLRKRSALGYLLEPLTQSLWLAGRED